MTAHREIGAPEWLSTLAARVEIVKICRCLAPLTSWLHTNVGPE